MTFDARSAKALPPGKHMLVPNCPGLRLVATATRKTWTYRYEDAQGKSYRRCRARSGFKPAHPIAGKHARCR